MTIHADPPALFNASRYRPPRIAVIVATKGRPAATPWVLALLARQTVRPDLVIFSASQEADVGACEGETLTVRRLYGPPGLPTQRNRGIDALPPEIDYVVFFDDDFAPGRHWIEQCRQVFHSQRAVIGLSGRTLRDGAAGRPVSWSEAFDIVGRAEDEAVEPVSLDACNSLYGCNMAYRVDAIRGVRFDERLVLYGWLEDQDFSRRLVVADRGELVRCHQMLGVHLGLSGGRVSGRKFGYSQVANAIYLYRKGVLSRKEAASNIFRAISVNFVKSMKPEPHLDRRGRLIGNFIGVAEICSGSVNPERAARL
ncbi:glycosyltransferase family 2 protein [Paraburkholderia phenazinium]|jgi:GT2 family glycosyltransferase|uniref:Glycosyltransferase, GT2 family n=1 Tax=Paraburkholderia phenazinium TaxID=60549 RepID=A0A1G8JF04_9BURK|nr:glycosyl transferase [Paraburkholderia phenazinium]SDI29220.1 Glycosyltransferase, GT2 family [Paraburkholderia phenazinium]